MSCLYVQKKHQSLKSMRKTIVLPVTYIARTKNRVSVLKDKKKKKEFFDDGRVIANMNVEGMRRSIIRRRAFDEFGEIKEEKKTFKLSKEEMKSMILGMATSYIMFGIVVFGFFGLFILFCVKVWFK